MHNKTLIFGILLIIWMLVIFGMSSATGNDSGSMSKNIVSYIVEKYDNLIQADYNTIEYHQTDEFLNLANYVFRKICHFMEYFILGILAFSFIYSFNKIKLSCCFIYSIIFSFIYALLDEYHQTFVDGRGGSIIDSLIDTSGAITGCLLLFLVFLYKKSVNNHKNHNIA